MNFGIGAMGIHGNIHFAEIHGEGVAPQQLSCEQFAGARKVFYGFGGLDCAYDAGSDAKRTSCRRLLGVCLEQAAVAWGVGQNCHGVSEVAPDSSVAEWLAGMYA